MPFTVAVPDMGRQLQLIAEGGGAGIVARRVLVPAPEEQGLQTFRIAGMSCSLEVWLFQRRNGPIIPVVVPVLQRLITALLQ